MNKPSPLLVVALAGVLLAAYFAPSPEDDEVLLSDRARAPAGRPPAADATVPVTSADRSARRPAAVEVLRIRPRQDSDPAGPWFPAPRPVRVAQAPRPAAPPPSAPPAPPPPQAPPLPFKALGHYTDGDQVGVFLQYRDQNLVARVGDTLAEQYKVESLAGGVLTLRYLPLNQTQTLDLGAAN